jgi:hypothetical protein
MFASERRMIQEAMPTAEGLDSAVRSLLDHVASQLAAEYVRLMESAAQAEAYEPEPCLKEAER